MGLLSRKWWRKILFICIFISMIFIIYQLNYYRILVNDSNANHHQKSHLPQEPEALNFVVDDLSHDDSRNPLSNQIDSPDSVDKSGEINQKMIDYATMLLMFKRNRFTRLPEEVETEPQQYFQCEHSKELIEIDHFNDDYCDCKDGSDEPSTSACSHLISTHARFSCHSSRCKVGKEHQTISYMKLNDGVCDCCDGSDEQNTMDISPNQYQMILYYALTNQKHYSIIGQCF